MNFQNLFSLEGKKDLFLVFGMIAILLVLFLPIPAGLLDFLLITNFSFGLLILLLTLYTERPLDFSTFPSLLLIATLFRLSLNIASTRLILDQGNAGHVIDAVGTHVVGGNYVIGLVVFLILVVVQFVVVTNGAQRVAEVAARFTLDSMPGKQMSIDADMNMGVIDEQQAKARRAEIEREANFYGAMDGSTKFVKGDAIAGIVIILVNIIGGLSIGIMQLDMNWSQAIYTFTLLTVGDGIVTQIPSLVIAVSTGIIITRAATDANLSQELSKQITSQPKALALIALILAGALFMPGLPVLQLMVILLIFAALAYVSFKRQKQSQEVEQSPLEGELDSTSTTAEGIYDKMTLNRLEVSLGEQLFQCIENDENFFKHKVTDMREQLARELGVVLPEIKFTHSSLIDENAYQILIDGIVYAQWQLRLDKMLAINSGRASVVLEGEQVSEPAYHLQAFWIAPEQAVQAKESGYTVVAPNTLLITHFNEIIKKNAAELIDRGETERLINRTGKSHQGLVEELIPNILTFSEVQFVLKELLTEGVSIRRMPLILECLIEQGKLDKNKHKMAEAVRERLGSQIIQGLKGSSDYLHVITLKPELEKRMSQSLADIEGRGVLVMPPDEMQSFAAILSQSCEKMLSDSKTPLIVCNAMLRKPLKLLINKIIPNIAVVGMNEIPDTTSMKVFDSIQP